MNLWSDAEFSQQILEHKILELVLFREQKSSLSAASVSKMPRINQKMNMLVLNKRRTESQILRSCGDYLSLRKYFFWRQSNTGIKRIDRHGREFWTASKYSRKGLPDIFLLKERVYAIEVKTTIGRQSPEQKEFQQAWERHGGVYLLVRSVDALIAAGL